MPPETVVFLGAYVLACVTAWGLHETAHYLVHRRHSESVRFGLNRYGPYVEAVYDHTAPTAAIRLGSLAPTLIYTPVVFLGGVYYLQLYPFPQLDPVEWSYVVVPLAILIVPTAADIHGCLNPGE